MPQPLENSSEMSPAEERAAASTHSAVDTCCDAWMRTHEAVLANGGHKLAAHMQANTAYCRAMPPLSGPQNIRDFIACVAHGMLINVFLHSSATKLLYAAQVAHNTLPKRSPGPRKQAK